MQLLSFSQDTPTNIKTSVNWTHTLHYLGYCYYHQRTSITDIPPSSGSWDDWVPQDRIRKNSEENKELAANLKSDLDKMTKPAKTTAQATKKKAAGSDLSSARGSEERSTPVMGRGQKRGRDFEIEKVGTSIPSIPDALPRPKRAKVVRTQGKQSKKRPTMSTPPAQKDALSAEEEYHDKPYVAPPPPKKKSSTLKEHEYDAIISSELNGRGAHAPVKTSEKPTKPTKKLIVAGTCLDCPPVDRRKDTIAKRNRMNQGRRAEKRIKWDTDCADKKANAKQEENFNQRPAIHIPVPDNLKSYLVDDWEYVTKNLSLLPLPAEHSANEVVDIYYNEEKTKRRIGSAEHDILQEVHAGMKEYFEKTLGKILLYRFERQQYLEARRSMAANQGEWKDKAIGDIYGAEHLARLLGMSIYHPSITCHISRR